MSANGYGFCPECYAPGIQRERGGNDKCRFGHIYPSDQSLTRIEAENRLWAVWKAADAAKEDAERKLKAFIEENPGPRESTGFADIFR